MSVYVSRFMSALMYTCVYIYIYIYFSHTHTSTYIYIYIYNMVYIYIYVHKTLGDWGTGKASVLLRRDNLLR